MRFNLRYCKRRQQAFSLLELAIVLVIIAIITGGILTGKDLLKTAELREVAEQANQYSDALRQFNDKYGYYPGDFPTATRIWGRADGDSDLRSNCTDPAEDIDTSNPKATCNGNGDGRIGYASSEFYETYRMWQHLVSAEMIAGSFTGTIGPDGSRDGNIGENIPETPVNAAGYSMYYLADSPASWPAEWFTGTIYHHALYVGAERAGNLFPHDAALTASNAFYVDEKFDDGQPGTGNVLTFDSDFQPDCVTSNNAATARYRRAEDREKVCTLIFLTGF